MEKLALVIGIVGGIMTILGFSVRELVSEYLLGQNKAIVLNVEAHKENGVIEDIMITTDQEVLVRNVRCDPFLLVKYTDQNQERKEMILLLPETVLDNPQSATTTGTIKKFRNSEEMERLAEGLRDTKEYYLMEERIQSISIMYQLHCEFDDLDGGQHEQTILCVTGLGDKKAESAAILSSMDPKELFTDEQRRWLQTIQNGEAYRYQMNLEADYLADEVRNVIRKAVTNDGGAFLIDMQVKKLGEETWKSSMEADTGDIVRYRIHIKNRTDDKLENVVVRVNCPSFLVYEEGSTTIANTSNPDGMAVSDRIIENSGINIGGYAAGGDAYIYFNAAVSDMIRERNYIVRMVGQVSAGEKTGTLESFADVYLTEDQS